MILFYETKLQRYFERVEKTRDWRGLSLAFWIADHDLIRSPSHHEHTRVEGALRCVARELNHRIAVDRQRLRAGECSFHALNEVIAVGLEFFLTIEVETRIVIHPTDQVDEARLARDEQICRVRTVVTRRRLFRFLWSDWHEDREAAQVRTEADPAAVVRFCGSNGSRCRSRGRRCGPGGRGWWPFGMLLRDGSEAEP